MSAHLPEDHHSIPESLKRQLESFRKHLWRRKVIEIISLGLIGLFLSFLLLFGLDRIWQTPIWARLLILLGGISLFVGFAPYWLHRWVWGHRHEGQLARLIAKKYPGLGDRLLGVIELQAQDENGDTLSPRLREAAMQVVAAEAQKRELDEALPTARHRKWGLAAMALLVLVATAFVFTPQAGWNALERWLKPFSDVERYTFTQLEKPITYLAVPYGEAFAVNLKLKKQSEQKPEIAIARFENQPEVTVGLKKNLYEFKFPGQQAEGVITFRIGDLKHRLKIQPKQRPVVLHTTVTVNPPEYLQIPESKVALNIGEISAVEGSKLSFDLETSSPLKKASFGPTEISGELVQSQGFVSAQGSMKISDVKSSFGPIDAGSTPFSIPFSWIDEFGLVGGQGFKIRVDAVKDQPPVAYIQGLDKQKAILPTETLDFEILGEDDFGIRKAGIEWSSYGTLPGEKPATAGEIIKSNGGPEVERITESTSFSPAAFNITPQRLILRAFVEDYFPERGRIYSEPVLIYVLSNEEHAQLKKAEFDRVINDLEDIARKELNMLDENQRLEKLDGKELQTEEAKDKLAEQKRAEEENIRAMEELTKRMEQLMKDTARNKNIDKETMKKMAEALKSMQELSDKEMPEVSEKLQEAGEESNTAEKSKEDTKKAVEEQKEVVEKMDKALAEAKDANKKFEASTFVTRLKKAAEDQNKIANDLISNLSKTLGVKESEIDPADKRKLVDSIKQQSLTASDIRWIQEDLGHYFARTNEALFKQVVDLMRDSKISVHEQKEILDLTLDISLEKIQSKLEDAHSYTAIETSKKSADKLNEWAALLEGAKDDGGGGGGGGGGGAPNAEDEDFEFMLRVMKMIQEQQDLRGRTRVLEQLKRDATAPIDPK
ncbi:MAG: hypothetical protein ACK5JP_11335 [Akkermansiaceae bacterium]